MLKIKERTIKSQKYTNKKELLLSENSLGLLFEKYRMSANKLLLPGFGGKGRYILLYN